MNYIYETEEIKLRPFCKDDISSYYLSWFNDQEVTKYMSHGLFPYHEKQAIDFWEKSIENGDLIWSVFVKENDCHIGNIALQNFNWINRTAEFAGIIGNKNYWKKGIATQAIAILFDHGFSKLNLNRIWLGTAETNKGMRKVASKLGMKEEGRLRKHLFLEDKYIDVVHYGIMKDEWFKWSMYF